MKTRVIRTALASAACMLLGVSIASAQATRTWVSGVGDDVNPCSRTAPCKTFAGAISKTAAGGEISVLDPGGFGAVTITKSITLSGVGINSSILGTNTNGVNITAGPNDIITLRNLQINGVGSGLAGVRMFSGAALIIDNVNIFGFDTGVEASAGNTTVYHSFISNNRSFGLNAKANSSITVEDSMLTNNNVAVQAMTAGTVRMSNNSIYNNLTGFGCGGGTLVSAGDNRKANNVGGTVPACAPTMSIAIQ
jgi:hypothetical protein